ncbi:Cytochrome P450 4V3, partial [Cyphomyrmex costatus]
SIWTENRKNMSPTFSTITLKESFNVFVRESLVLIDDLEKIALNGNEFICYDYLYRCTINIACDIWRYRFRNIYIMPDVIFNLTSSGNKQRECLNILHSLIEKMIQQRTNELSTMSTNGDISHKRFVDILMGLFRDNKFTQKEVMDNIVTMMGAAMDTTATTLNFVIIMLANFSEIQEKAYKELLEIYGTETPKFAPVKYEDLQHMHYLDCVIKETLRLFPSIPLIGRELTEDLKIGEFVLPKGANVLIPIIRMHRNKKYWSNPLMFDPDRFLSEKTNCLPYYFMPFSDGLRNCIGAKYAMMSIKVILATLIRMFVFKLNQSIEIDKIKLDSDIVLSTVEPLKIKIKKRNLLP